MNQTKFTIDGWLDMDGTALFEGYTDGSTWNGWEKPYFTKEEGIRLVEFMGTGQYDEEADWFVVGIEDFCPTQETLARLRENIESEENFEVYTPEIIFVNGKAVKVYGIGRGCWIWDEVEEQL